MKTRLFLLAIVLNVTFAFAQTTIDADNPAFVYSGRIDYTNPKQVQFGYSGCRIRTLFEGTSIQVKISSPENANYIYVLIDSVIVNKFSVTQATTTIQVAQGLRDTIHSFELVKITESGQGKCTFSGIIIDNGKTVLAGITPESRKIHFIGNSITCGYGIEVLDRNLHFTPASENFYDAYAALTSRSLGADYNIVSRSGIGIYRNYGDPTTGNTSSSCMYDIYDRIFYNTVTPKYDYSFQPDVLCVNLGTNDFSESKGNASLFSAQYSKFIDTLRLHYPAAKIVLLCGPMLNTSAIKTILQTLVQDKTTAGDLNISFFELSAQGSLGYSADWHPSRAQARKNAKELIQYISTLMSWDAYPIIETIATSNAGKSITIECNEDINLSATNTNKFSITRNGNAIQIDSIRTLNTKGIILYLHDYIRQNEEIMVAYRDTTITSTNGKKLQYFSRIPVVNSIMDITISSGNFIANSVILNTNKNLTNSISCNDFSIVTPENVNIPIESVSLSGKYITITIPSTTEIIDDSLYISYNGICALASDNVPLFPFTNYGIKRTTTEIVKISKNTSFSCFPNPLGNNDLTLQFANSSNKTISIYYTNGALLYSTNCFSETCTINSSIFAKQGNYIVEVSFDNYKETVVIGK